MSFPQRSYLPAKSCTPQVRYDNADIWLTIAQPTDGKPFVLKLHIYVQRMKYTMSSTHTFTWTDCWIYLNSKTAKSQKEMDWESWRSIGHHCCHCPRAWYVFLNVDSMLSWSTLMKTCHIYGHQILPKNFAHLVVQIQELSSAQQLNQKWHYRVLP